MAVTPFLKLQKPPFDTIPWDEAVNGNMDIIDAFVQRYMAVPNYMGAWANSTMYVSGQNVLDITNATIYLCLATHTSSASPTTFLQDRTTFPTYWATTTNVVSGGNAVLSIGEATPLSAKAGDLWWNSAEGQLYILYNDGNSLQWVVANNQSGNIGDAPRDGNIYGRQMGAWVGSVNSQDVGRNKLHNGLFTVAQRGVGPWTTNVYTLDRWSTGIITDAASFAQGLMSDANRAQISDEAATYYLSNVFTGNAAAGACNYIWQPIEDVRRLAGKTVIVSFWAAAGATPKLGVNISQVFGTGGSPSAALNVAGQSVTLTTGFVRYSLTFVIPSVAGKTLGTNGNSYTGLQIWFSAGATNNASSGSVGVQSGTVLLWGVQLEIAAPGQTQPTPLEKLDPRMELSNCQRFYCVGNAQLNGYNVAGGSLGAVGTFPVTMRATPTLTPAGTGGANYTAFSFTNISPGSGWLLTFNASATGAASWAGTFTASADL